MDVPTIVGFSILQYAKLRMLEFYYDFMDKYVDRADFEYVEMDTDSAYMALSAPNLRDVIRPSMLDSFYEHYGEWFPRPYCEQHRDSFRRTNSAREQWKMSECCKSVYQHDTRTPGLFKEEFEGEGIVALNSKTYFCWTNDGESKYSSKGLSKVTNQLTKDNFLEVLRSKQSQQGNNTGFVRKNNTTYTYKQLKTGLTYFYAKRQVCDDGVSTKNIRC